MGHVLIVEDDVIIAMHLQMMVEEFGFTSIALAATEAEAVASALASPPTIILSDVDLEQGNGPEAVRQIHKALGPIDVIFLTGNPESALLDDNQAPVLTKPVRSAVLARTMFSLSSGDDARRG